MLETAVFYLLLGTGLRESELVTIDVHQYRDKGLYDVIRHKSKRVTGKIPIPQEARLFLDQYLSSRNSTSEEPLFIGRYGARLKTLDIYRICQRVLKQALAYLPEQEKFHFTPHKLRHTFLKEGNRQTWSTFCSGNERKCFDQRDISLCKA